MDPKDCRQLHISLHFPFVSLFSYCYSCRKDAAQTSFTKDFDEGMYVVVFRDRDIYDENAHL